MKGNEMSWTTHHSGTVGGRPIVVQTHDEGGFRVRTDQGEDFPGNVTVDGSSTIIMSPTAQGTPVDIEGETLDEVRQGLAAEGFDAQQIGEIVGHFPA